MKLEIRFVRESEIGDVVDMHNASFPDFFLSQLGSKFLTLYYAGVSQHSGGILLVATRGNELVAFVSGAENQIALYRELLQTSRWKFARAALPAVLRNPSIALRVARANSEADALNEPEPDAWLTSIGVRPEYQGEGVGKALFDAFEQELYTRGISAYMLTTDAEGNESVNEFYKRQGLMVSRSFVTKEGRPMNVYTRCR